MIRPVFPEHGEAIADLTEFLFADPERRTGSEGRRRPWVMDNMVNSVDGATAVDGGATGLTDEDDQALFHAFRGICDVILVGASTVRAEDYGPVSLTDQAGDARRRRGLSPAPRLAVISRSLELEPDSRLFSDPDHMPLILTCATAPPVLAARLADLAEVIVAGEEAVDLPRAMASLGERGHRVVLCEGGPTLNGHLVAGDLIDEINLTTAPVVVAGEAQRIVRSSTPVASPLAFTLDRLLVGERTLFARWLRRRT